MSLQLTLPGIEWTDYANALPGNYAGPRLKDAVVHAWRANAAELHIQELEYPDFSIRHVSGRYIRRVQVAGWLSKEGLHGSFMLANNVRKEMSSLGTVHLRKDHHLLSYASYTDCEGLFEEPAYFEILDVFYTPALIRQLVAYYPGLSGMIAGHQNLLIGNGSCWTPPSLRELYRHLICYPYEAGWGQLYFDLKMRELLLQLLQNSIGFEERALRFTHYETERIYEARHILEGCINRKPPTIRELSLKVALNEFTLKQGFRHFFKQSIFAWVREQKLYQAKQLLEDTRQPIKDIALHTGYPIPANFTTAFRKQFGITPKAVRR